MEQIYKLYTDGSYSKVFNKCGIGGLLEDESGNKIFEFSESYDDKQLKDKFEIMALSKGLQIAIQYDIKNIMCHTDDKNLAAICNIKDKQQLNHYIVSNPELHRVTDLINEFDNIDFAYLPRKLNKKADAISRKYISEANANNETLKAPTEFTFHAENFVHSYKYKRNHTYEQQLFKDKKNTVQNIFVFDAKQTEKGMHLKVYLATIANGLDYSKIYDAPLVGKPGAIIPHIIDTILQQYTHLKTCAFFNTGEMMHYMEDILKGISPYKKQYKPIYDSLSNTISQFDEVIYSHYAYIKKAVEPPVFEIQEDLTIPKEDRLINAMRILGNPDYQLGQDLSIERRFELPPSKQDDISEIQKKYFGEFMKLVLRNDINPEAGNIIVKNNPQDIKKKIQGIKEQLIEKGVQFRM